MISTKSCAAANEKLRCNFEKAALQESGAFLPLSCGFQAPTFRHPRLGLAEVRDALPYRALPFRDGIADGASQPFSLVFTWYRASIAEIPLLWGGGIAPPLRMLFQAERLRKGGGGIAPNSQRVFKGKKTLKVIFIF